VSFSSVEILTNKTTTGAGNKFTPRYVKRSFQAYGTTSSGSGSVSIKIEASNIAIPDETDWIELGTIYLTLGTTRTTDGFTTDAPWRHVRGNVTSISGTGASVSATMGG